MDGLCRGKKITNACVTYCTYVFYLFHQNIIEAALGPIRVIGDIRTISGLYINKILIR